LTFTRLPALFLTGLVLSAILSVTGCGGGGGGTPEAANRQPAVSIARATSGDYLIQGDNMDGVAGLKLTLTYDSSTMASPTVIRSGLISSGLMEPNTNVPGSIIIGVISSTPFSGSGEIAAVSFASQTGAETLAIASVELYDVKGQMIYQQVQ